MSIRHEIDGATAVPRHRQRMEPVNVHQAKTQLSQLLQGDRPCLIALL